jgi:D-inositol-3-phosphate glycosyltransferase
VTFVGCKPRSELKYYYSAADLFVTMPWYEPFGITPLESMACGTPVIGSAVGGIKYTVRHGDTGFLVPPRDEEALAWRMAATLADREMLEFFRGRAVARAHNFNWSIITTMIGDLYEEVAMETYASTGNIFG